MSAWVAAQITAIRKAHGWSQKKLAGATGMAAARISVLENPSYDNYNISTLNKIADAFGVKLLIAFIPSRGSGNDN